MKLFLTAISFLFLFRGISKAETPTMWWIAFSTMFTQNQINTAISYGGKDMPQPYQNTQLLFPNNTNFYQLGVATQTNAENAALLLLEAQHKIQRWFSFLTKKHYSSNRGEWVDDPPEVRKFIQQDDFLNFYWSTPIPSIPIEAVQITTP